jgi:hypothetical protein
MRQSGLAGKPDIRPFMMGGVVEDSMDQSLVRVASFNFGKKLRRESRRPWLARQSCVRVSQAMTPWIMLQLTRVVKDPG